MAKRKKLLLCFYFLTALAVFAAVSCYATDGNIPPQNPVLPTGGEVTKGKANIEYFETKVDVTLLTNDVGIQWTSLIVGFGGSLNFIWTGQGIANVVNTVIGNQVSRIDGGVTGPSNLNVWVSNPNGIIFGPTAQISVGSLIATTMNISQDKDGNYIFSKYEGSKNAYILNYGNIKANRPGGFVLLLSQAVGNIGDKAIIVANTGTVALASGEKVKVISLDNKDAIRIEIPEGVQEEVFGPDNNKIDSAVKNSKDGTIQADGGHVILTAKVMNKVFDYAINNEGVIQANNLVNNNGVVELIAEGAPVINSDKIEAGSIKIDLHGCDFINHGAINATGISGLPGDGKVSISAANIHLQYQYDKVILATRLIELIATGKIDVINADDSPYSVNGADFSDAILPILLEAPTVQLSARQFGTNAAPLKIKADNINITRLEGDIGILDSLGLGTSILIHGPPEGGFGAIIYNHDANLTLDADQINLIGPDSIYLYGNITFSNLSCTVPDKKIYFEAGKTYTILGTFKIQGAYGRPVRLLSSDKGHYWYFDPKGAIDITYAWVEDGYNRGPVEVPMTLSNNNGGTHNWDAAVSWVGGSGSWSTGSNWSTGSVPGAGDDVTIDKDNVTVTLDVTTTINSLTIGDDVSGARKSGITLLFSGTNSLTVNGTIVVNRPQTNSTTNTITVGAGTLSAASITINGASNTRVGSVTVSTGTINVTGDITFVGTAANARLTSAGASMINVGGNFGSGGTFSAGTGTVNFKGSGSQTIGSYTYNNVTIASTSSANSAGNITINGTFTVNGLFTPAAADIISGSGTLAGTGTVKVTRTAATADFNSQCTISTKTLTNLTVQYSGTAAQVVSGITYGNLRISNTAAAVTASSNFNVTGTLTVDSGAILQPAAGVVINNAGAQGTITGSGTVRVTRTAATADYSSQYKFTTNTLTNLTVDYAGTGEVLSNLTYGNLKVSGSITGAGNFATVNGIFTVTGTFTPTSGTITMNNGSSIVNSGTLTFSNLTIASSATVATASSFSITGALTVNSGANFSPSAGTITMTGTGWTVSNSGTLTFSGLTIAGTPATQPATSFNVSGILTVNATRTLAPTAGTITMNNSSSVSNSGTLTFNNLTIASGASVTGTGNFAVNGTFTLTDSGSVFTPAAAEVISGTGTLTGSGTVKVTRTAATANFSSQYTIANKTLTNLTVEYAGTGAQTVSPITYGNLKINMPGQTATLGGAIVVNGNLTLASGTLDASASNYEITIKGNWINSGGSFNARNGTVTYSGTGAQSITTGGSSFYNLTVTNASSSGVTFTDSCTVSGTFTDTTQDSKLNFHAGSTYAFANINIHGASGHNIIMTSTGTWNFNVSQASPAVSYVTVDYSNASGGNQINAMNNCTDNGGNTNWLFAAAISKIVFTTSAQTLTAGQVSGIMTIQTQSATGSPVNVTGNTTVNLTSDSTGTYTFYSDAAGTHPITSVTIAAGTNSASFYYKDTKAGNPTLTATPASQPWTPATQIETVNPGALDHFTVTGITDPQTAGIFSSPIVTAYDQYDNIKTDYAGTVHFTTDDSNATLPADYLFTAGTGTHTFTNELQLRGTSAGCYIKVADGAATGQQSGIVVNPAALDHFTVTGITDPQIAGALSSPVVTAYDAYSNIKTDYTGTAHFTSSDALATLPTDYTFTVGAGQDNGVHTFTNGIILRTATTTGSVIVTDTVSLKTGSQTGITVNPEPANPTTAITTNNALFAAILANSENIVVRPSVRDMKVYQVTTPPSVTGPIYFYHPLTPTDLSAFDDIKLDAGAYEFIENSLSLKTHVSSYYGL